MDLDIPGLTTWKDFVSIPLIQRLGLWGQFGEITQFNKGRMERISYRKNGVKTKLVKDRDMLTLYNFKEWIKMQQYADKYL